MKRLLVTIAPPTPNGDLHLGHIAGPYMAADIYARTQRAKGHEVLFLSYSDDYQSYLARKARELDAEPFALGLKNGAMIHETLGLLDIHVDTWMQSGHNPYFRDAVQTFFEAAQARGTLRTRPHKVPYFPAYDVWGYEAYARGACNYCGTSSDASQCEHCAQSPDILKMQDIRCTLGPSPVEWREVERDCLSIGSYRDFLRDLYRDKPLRPYLKDWLEEVLGQDDEQLEWFTTRPHEHGVTIPTDGGKVVHTWFSGIAGYYAATREYADRVGDDGLFDRFWRDPASRIVHFLGFDCCFSHAIAYPSLLSNLEGFTRDVHLFPNRFLKLNGGDFSTSRGHAIWVRDIIKQAEPDAVRLYLASVAPELEVQDYRQDEFDRWHRDVYLDLLPAIAKAAAGGGARAADAGFREDLDRARASWREAADIETFSMQKLARTAMVLAEVAREKLAEGADVRVLAAGLAGLMEAVAPTLSRRLAEAAGAAEDDLRAWLQGRADLPLPARQSAAAPT